MKIATSRREFLTQMSLVVMLPRRLTAQGIQTATSKVGANLGPDQLQVLAAAMDEIIPRRDGMPSATDAGGLEYFPYLGCQYPTIQEDMSGFLDAMRQAATGQL